MIGFFLIFTSIFSIANYLLSSRLSRKKFGRVGLPKLYIYYYPMVFFTLMLFGLESVLIWDVEAILGVGLSSIAIPYIYPEIFMNVSNRILRIPIFATLLFTVLYFLGF